MLFFDKGIKIIEEISAAQYSSYKSKDHPKAFMVVGQPGAGKTQIIKKICEEKVIAFINGDSYRKFYPNYHALYKKYGDKIVNITKPLDKREHFCSYTCSVLYKKEHAKKI